MIKYYSADYVYTGVGDPIENGIVAMEDKVILGIHRKEELETGQRSVKHMSGILVPGFVNTHCHLELSYLKDRVPQHTGLIEFIKAMIGERKHYNQDLAYERMLLADLEMYRNGIVAVGDISNHAGSKDVKQKSKIYYHTFVEVMGADASKAADIYRLGADLCQEFSPLPASIVPHAPYSVSKDLFKLIGRMDRYEKALLSVHNQECSDENNFFRYKTGGFVDFYNQFNIDARAFNAHGRDSLQTFIINIPKTSPVLLVHNTYTKMRDIYFLKRTGHEVSFCFCPGANLYIEGRLPQIDIFPRTGFNLTLGTDSLASNDKLCILSEMKHIQQAFSDISLRELVQWATINGARFLRIDDVYGSLEVGKKPGLNLITNVEDHKLSASSTVKRIV